MPTPTKYIVEKNHKANFPKIEELMVAAGFVDTNNTLDYARLAAAARVSPPVLKRMRDTGQRKYKSTFRALAVALHIGENRWQELTLLDQPPPATSDAVANAPHPSLPTTTPPPPRREIIIIVDVNALAAAIRQLANIDDLPPYVLHVRDIANAAGAPWGIGDGFEGSLHIEIEMDELDAILLVQAFWDGKLTELGIICLTLPSSQATITHQATLPWRQPVPIDTAASLRTLQEQYQHQLDNPTHPQVTITLAHIQALRNTPQAFAINTTRDGDTVIQIVMSDQASAEAIKDYLKNTKGVMGNIEVRNDSSTQNYRWVVQLDIAEAKRVGVLPENADNLPFRKPASAAFNPREQRASPNPGHAQTPQVTITEAPIDALRRNPGSPAMPTITEAHMQALRNTPGAFTINTTRDGSTVFHAVMSDADSARAMAEYMNQHGHTSNASAHQSSTQQGKWVVQIPFAEAQKPQAAAFMPQGYTFPNEQRAATSFNPRKVGAGHHSPIPEHVAEQG